MKVYLSIMQQHTSSRGLHIVPSSIRTTVEMEKDNNYYKIAEVC